MISNRWKHFWSGGVCLLAVLSWWGGASRATAQVATGNGSGVTVEQLAESLAGAETEEQRRQLWDTLPTGVLQLLGPALLDVGKRLRRQDQPAALRAYAQAQRVAQVTADKRLLCEILQGIGDTHYNARDYEAALTAYRQSQPLAEELVAPDLRAYALSGIGDVYYQQDKFAPAQQFYQQSIELLKQTGNQTALANIYGSLGVMQVKQGNYQKAAAYYQEGLELAAKLPGKGLYNLGLIRLGFLHYRQGNYQLALNYQQRALALARHRQDPVLVARTLQDLGLVYYDLKQYDQAQACYKESLPLTEQSGSQQDLAHLFNRLGLVARAQQRYEMAREYYQKSLAVAEQLGDKAGMSRALSNLGNSYFIQGNAAQGLECWERAAALAYEAGELESFWNCSTNVGRAYLKLGRPDDAQRAWRNAIEAIEQLRGNLAGGATERQAFMADRLTPYHNLVSLLVQRGEVAEAFALVQQAKGRVLLDVMQSGPVARTNALSPVEQAQETQLHQALAALNSEIYRVQAQPQPAPERLAQLTAQLQTARANLETWRAEQNIAHPKLSLQRGALPQLTKTDLATLVPNDQTALLDFLVTPEQTYLFVATRTAPSAATPPAPATAAAIALRVYTIAVTAQDLTTRTEVLRRRLAQRAYDFHPLTRAFYELLLRPAQDQLTGKTALVIVPDGDLWNVPFQALQSAPNRYLIEDYTLNYAPSLAVWRAARRVPAQHPAASLGLLALGNPALPATSSPAAFASLPEVETQVRALSRLYDVSRSRILWGQAAQKSRFKTEAGSYRVLHLATHGVLNDTAPLYSYLQLAPDANGPSADGMLEAWEIMELPLTADLAILAACDTGRGRIGAGEGVIGLSWAFFVAGCPTVVVSQWRVEAGSTAALMHELHRNLQAPRPPATALQQAARSLLQQPQYRHPFYWAGFRTVGNGL